MANITVPDFVRRAARVISTQDDATYVDTLISVGATVLIAMPLAAVVSAVLPLLPTFLVLPLTAGGVQVAANHLAE